MVDTMNYLVNKKVSVLTNKTFARNDRSFLQTLVPYIHWSLSLWCAHTSCPLVCLSLRLQDLIWTLTSGYYPGEIRRVAASIY